MGKRDLVDRMTAKEVACFLKVSISSVRRWCQSGKMRAFKVEGRGEWSIPPKSVLDFLQKQ